MALKLAQGVMGIVLIFLLLWSVGGHQVFPLIERSALYQFQ
jgi:hypothetical protein